MQPHNKHLRVSFGPFVADLRSGELHSEGRRIHLQDQPFQVLSVLLGRAGELVTRDELRSEVWPSDTFLEFDHALNTAIKKIRIALSDDAVTPRYIQTIPKRGYRWIAPVTVCEAGTAERVKPASKTWHGSAKAFACGVVLALIASSLLSLSSRVSTSPRVTMAITSDPNTAADPRLELLRQGVALQAAGRIAQLTSNVQITASPEVAGKPATDDDQADPAHSKTRLSYIVHLNLQSTPQRIRADVEMIRTPDRMRIWHESFDHERADPLQLEADLAREIAAQLVRFLPEAGR